MEGQQRSLFLGTFVHSQTLDSLEFLHDTAICVDEKGIIAAVEPDCDLSKAQERVLPKLGWSVEHVKIWTTQPGDFFFPGFIGE